jgi:DNA-binding transcriptional MocR family regulator
MLVAIALADHCHDDGSEAFPSQRLLSEKTGLSERTVRDTLQELVRLGVIVIQKKSGQHRPNNYRFPIPDWFAKLRPERDSGLSPEGKMVHQRGNSRRSEGRQLPPNHKEPSLETTAVSISVPMPVNFKDVFKILDSSIGE